MIFVGFVTFLIQSELSEENIYAAGHDLVAISGKYTIKRPENGNETNKKHDIKFVLFSYYR